MMVIQFPVIKIGVFSHRDLEAFGQTWRLRQPVYNRRVMRLKGKCQLGIGVACYLDAAKCLLEGRMFEVPWMKVVRTSHLIHVRQWFALVFSKGIFHVANIGYISRIVNEHSGRNRSMMIVCHSTRRSALIGTERFKLQYDGATDSVEYQIKSWSSLPHALRPFALLIRCQQRRFVNDSIAAMKHCVESGSQSS
jgi:uncharacterized protein (UPF0548 family)